MRKPSTLFVFIMMVSIAGCLSAGTSARLCSDLGFFSRAANVFGSKVSTAIEDYTPKKCIDGGISGDTGNLTGGINLGIHNEPSSTVHPVEPEPVPQ